MTLRNSALDGSALRYSATRTNNSSTSQFIKKIGHAIEPQVDMEAAMMVQFPWLE